MGNAYGIDIGTSNFKMCCSDKDKILNEKNIIAIANKTEILAFGDEAYEMYEKAPEHIEVSFPVKFGVIADIENMQTLLFNFFNKINEGKKITGSDFYIAVPTDVTEVEKRAFYELVVDSKVKAKNVYVVDKPVADAIGAGLDVTKSKGIMIVNIGAETTEISVLSLGGIVISKAVKIGGNKLDDCIISNVRKAYNLVIGSKTAENLKKQLGSAVPVSESFAPGFGRNVLSGLPVSVDISSDIIYQAIIDSLHSIMDAIKVILERTPPELAADIIKDGVYFTGGTYAKLSSVSPAISGKNHEQKVNLQGENHYKKRIRKQKFSSVLLWQRRRYICGHLPPARANDAKREAIWYSELYLSLADRNFNTHGGDELRLI